MNAAAPSDADKADAFEWSPATGATADNSAGSPGRAPATNPSVTLWDEIAPEVPRLYRDSVEGGDDTSEA
ncbi:hypothetical protein QCE42_09320 [Caballeronia sp. LZ050]|nr:hypothetical protein [Caballeronia sp. LZ050]